jgi:hypothetical protein
MTAYFMHYCKKLKAKFLLVMYCLGIVSAVFCSSATSLAAPAQLTIKSAELQAQDDKFHVALDLDLQFNGALEEALNKGVPLTLLYEFQLTQPRKYWFDEEVISQSQRITISYHALSRQYLIKRHQQQQSYANLAQAKEALSKIKDWVVFDKSLLHKGEPYSAALRVRLDQSRLPKALQAEAASSEEWSMVSERFRWTPAFNL